MNLVGHFIRKKGLCSASRDTSVMLRLSIPSDSGVYRVTIGTVNSRVAVYIQYFLSEDKTPDLQGYLTAEDKCYLKKLPMYVGKEDKVEKMITFYN